MNRDRGTMKWNAMMLPEHVKLLREWKEEDDRAERPDLDEWALQEMNVQIEAAHRHRLPIQLTVWEEGGCSTLTTMIEGVDIGKRSLSIAEGKTIPLENLYGALLLE